MWLTSYLLILEAFFFPQYGHTQLAQTQQLRTEQHRLAKLEQEEWLSNFTADFKFKRERWLNSTTTPFPALKKMTTPELINYIRSKNEAILQRSETIKTSISDLRSQKEERRDKLSKSRAQLRTLRSKIYSQSFRELREIKKDFNQQIKSLSVRRLEILKPQTQEGK